MWTLFSAASCPSPGVISGFSVLQSPGVSDQNGLFYTEGSLRGGAPPSGSWAAKSAMEPLVPGSGPWQAPLLLDCPDGAQNRDCAFSCFSFTLVSSALAMLEVSLLSLLSSRPSSILKAGRGLHVGLNWELHLSFYRRCPLCDAESDCTVGVNPSHPGPAPGRGWGGSDKVQGGCIGAQRRFRGLSSSTYSRPLNGLQRLPIKTCMYYFPPKTVFINRN